VEDPITVTPTLAIPLAEIEIRTSRSSGPGGQHANVTASRVEAVLEIAASTALGSEQKARLIARHGARVTATSQDSRSQARNREQALERLREKLVAGLAVPRERRRTRPSRTAREQRLDSKRRTAERKRGRRRPELED
jgi:ribosome-associated protein